MLLVLNLFFKSSFHKVVTNHVYQRENRRFRSWIPIKVSRKDTHDFIGVNMTSSMCVSVVLSDLSALPAALASEQWLHHSVGLRDARGGREVYQLPRSSQSITQSCQSPETPLHRLLWHRHPAERVSKDTHRILHPFSSSSTPSPSIFVFPLA